MNKWKTIPHGTRAVPNLATWRRSDMDDTLTDYICRGYLVKEDATEIDCIIGYCVIGDGNDEYITPNFYKEV